MKLIEMRVKDFCGIKMFATGLFGKNAIIEGANETGKSSLNNALLWCLFEKDTNGKKLNPKPRNTKTNKWILGTEPKVELVLETDSGNKITLTRIQSEDITGKKSSTPVYKGDKGIYEIDGVPVTKKEFENKIVELVGDEEVFRMITDPHPILSGKDWKARRDMLQKFMGELRIEDELSSSDIEILDGRPVADAVKVAKAALTRADERAGLIPKLIDENYQKIVQIDGSEEEIKALIEQTAYERMALETGDKDRIRLSELKAKLESLKRTESAAFAEKTANLKLNERQNEAKLRQTNTEYSYCNNRIDMLRSEITESKGRLVKLRADYDEIKEKIFVPSNCSYCNQPLPEFMAQEMEAKFNAQKATELKNNIENGKKIKALITEKEKELEELTKKHELLAKEKEMLEEARKSIQSEISSIAYVPSPKIAETESEIKIESDKAIRNVPDSSRIYQLKEKENSLRKQLSDIEKNRSYQERIAELNNELEELQNTITELKRVKELTLQVQRKWNEKIEEKANSLFKLVKWKLSEENKNGDIEDCCEAMIDGIEYNKTLNTGNKINAIIDVSNTFSVFFQKQYPIFIDNAEAVTKWKVVPVNQYIMLKAVEGIDKLNINFM